MARGIGVCIALLLLGLATSGAAASTDNQTLPGRIVPGASVGKLRLGMSVREARRVLAPIGSRRLVRLGHPSGASDRGTRTQCSRTLLRSADNRTLRGIGVGSPEKKLLRAYPNLVRIDFAALEQTRTEYRLGLRWRRHTVFVVKGGHTMNGITTARTVTRVMLRAPGVPLGY